MDDGDRSVSEVYDRLAPAYDRRWAFYVRASVRETLRRLEPAPGARVGDIGCGTGELLRRLQEVEPSARGVGVDLSYGMLSVARAKLGGSGALVAADAARLPLASDGLDLAVSTNSLHFWRRPRRALREIARILRPGGRLLVTDWCDDYWACRLCDRLLRIFDPAHHRTYGTDELGEMLQGAGFTGVTVERYRIGWIWGLMTAAAEAPSAPAEAPSAPADVGPSDSSRPDRDRDGEGETRGGTSAYSAPSPTGLPEPPAESET